MKQRTKLFLTIFLTTLMLINLIIIILAVGYWIPASKSFPQNVKFNSIPSEIFSGLEEKGVKLSQSSITYSPDTPFRILRDEYNRIVIRNNIKYYVDDFNIENLIDKKTIKNPETKREKITEYIWKGKGLPEGIPSIEKNIFDTRYKNVKQIDKFTIDMNYGLNSIAYLFYPTESNGDLVIYHEGHGGDFFLGKETINSFLNRGYTVIAFSMPLLGMNNQPIVENFGKLEEHSDLSILESDDFSTFEFFLNPIYLSLNYLEKDFENIYMIGISGGGWTTTLYSAIDTRIDKSYPVAGSLPLIYPADREYEQGTDKAIYKFYDTIASYTDLYILASHDRRQVQILNLNDKCCFEGSDYMSLPYENNIKKYGDFEVLIINERQHIITQEALDFILLDIR